MQTLHSYTMFTSSSKYFRTCSKIAIIIWGQWWIWSLDPNSSGFLFQEILTAPLASQLQEPEELVSSLENVQIQYLILDSISQADKIFCCIFACVWFQRCCLLRTWYWSDHLKSLRDWGIQYLMIMTAISYLWFRKTLPTCDMSLKAGPEEPCVRPNPQVRHTPQDTASPRRARHFPIHLTFVLSFELSGKVCKCFEENFRCKKKIGFYWIQDSSGICWHCIRAKIS